MTETIYQLDQTNTVISSEKFQYVPVALANPETVLNVAVELDTITALRALDTTGLANGTSRKVKGYYTPYDVAMPQTFFWDPTSTATDDGFSIIEPTAGGTGRWVYPVGEMPFPLSAAGATTGSDATPFLEAVLASGARAVLDDDYQFNTAATIASGQTVLIYHGVSLGGSSGITNDGTVIYIESIWSGITGNGSYLDLAGGGSLPEGVPVLREGENARLYVDPTDRSIKAVYPGGVTATLATPNVYTASTQEGLLPSPWTWAPDFDIGYAATSIDYENDIGDTLNYFVSESGDDATLDGTSSLTPYRTISAAIAAGIAATVDDDPFSVTVVGGTYYQTEWAPGTGSANRLPERREFALVGVQSDVILTSSPKNISWTNNGDGTYTASVANVFSVVDTSVKTPIGDVYETLEEYSSVANLLAGGNGFFSDNVNVTVKVGRAPDSDILANVSDYNVWNNFRTGPRSLLKGLRFAGVRLNLQPSSPLSTSDNFHRLDNVHYMGVDSDPLQVQGSTSPAFTYVYSRQVRLSRSPADGFNYNNRVRGIEENCFCEFAGWNTPGPNQGSTAHNSGCDIIRVFGTYRDSQQPNIADVNGALGWQINCTLENNLNLTNATAGTGTTMWFDTCTLIPGSGLTNFSSTGTFFLRNTEGSGANVSNY
ncbi:MAG: hypothetical protein QNJ46_05870 [Leptolyngbyaceae cyanobacterium MO_188.B28]|nr:hypothetical protein [Leptolyngbyaceae cyanobacterium MO_188.B28]